MAWMLGQSRARSSLCGGERSGLLDKLAVTVVAVLIAVALLPAQALAGDGAPASETDYGDRMELDAERLTPVTVDMLEEGTYNIAVRTDSQLFRVVFCTITVKDGTITADMTLGGHGYRELYLGVGEDAYVADGSEYSKYSVDEEGRYVYTVEIPGLNETVDITALSARKNLWYDHQVIFLAASLPTDALTDEGLKAVQESSTVKNLPDGVYTCTPSLSGGSGRVSLSDPCQVTLKDGMGVARIEWSSQYYDYMIVNGEKYYPVNDGGDSVFEIPINAFDIPMDVVADTTALSQPYEIEYQITFYSSSLQQKSSSSGPGWPVVVVVVCIFAIGYLVVVAAAKRTHRTARERRK